MIPLCGLLTYAAVDGILSRCVGGCGQSGAIVVTGLGYTLPAVVAVIAVVCRWNSPCCAPGCSAEAAYWISMVIVFGFQILVDGWLTKLSAPIVIYDEQHTSGHPFPVRHPCGGFLIRLGAGHRGAAAVGTVAAARPRRGSAVSLGVGGLPRSEVPAAFDAAAAGYDGLVGLNPGYHAHLRISARRLGIAAGGRGSRLLDAGCGTGASTAALLAAAPQAQIVAVDASARMLAMAAGKRWPDSVRFVYSRIEDLADAGVVGPFDGILAAYLIRNLADPDETLRRFAACCVRAVGSPCTNTRCGDSRRATATWNAVCGAVIIPAGRLRSGDATLYRHLRRSVNAFDGASASENVCAATVSPSAQPDDAGLAARHRAHLHRDGAPMTDPRRAEHPHRPVRPDAATTGGRPHVVVVGAGIAGLAAATALAERGVTVESSKKSSIWVAASAAGPRRCPTVPRWR